MDSLADADAAKMEANAHFKGLWDCPSVTMTYLRPAFPPDRPLPNLPSNGSCTLLFLSKLSR